MIDDPEERNRGVALELLGKFGRPDAAPVIVAKLQQRAKGLDRKAIHDDFTFAAGRDAVALLTARALGKPLPTATTNPKEAGPPGMIHAASEPPTLPGAFPRTSPSPNRKTSQNPNPTTLPTPTATISPNPNSRNGNATPSQVEGERRKLVWPWVVGIIALVVTVAFVLKRRP
jgi:hypothetical protein